uniref:Kinesin light chain n=1 Tax=Odontella aurita TaxID=265563 RepID=A0A7S4K140_9STRA
MSNIATVHAEQSEWRYAISRYNEALEIQMEQFGEDDQEVANTLTNLGTMNFRFGNLPLALKSYKQAWRMRQNIFGSAHIHVSDALLNVALVHEHMGNIARAESCYANALRAAKNSVGDQHLKVALLKNSLANICLHTGKEELALKFFSDVWTIYKINGLDDEHDLVKIVSRNIADIRFKNQDDLAGVLTAFYDVLRFFSQMRASAFSLDDPGVDTFLKNVGQANANFTMAVC